MAKVYPPMFSADSEELEVGQKIYYTESCCNSYSPYKVKEGTITELVLTAARTIRVRKEKGREVVISMSSRAGLCSVEGVDEQLIFASREMAILQAKELSLPTLKRLEEEVRRKELERIDLLAEEKQERLTKNRWLEGSIETSKKTLAGYKSELESIS